MALPAAADRLGAQDRTWDGKAMDTAESLQPTYTFVERFEPGDPRSVAFLKEFGYVVIKKVLSDGEAATAVELAWEYLEGVGTGIDRSDVETWDDERWPTLAHGGLIPGHGVGQTACMWHVRSAPRIKQAFAAVWETEELLVSFDAMALWRPWQYNPTWRTNAGASWMHIDQNPITRPGLQCVQVRLFPPFLQLLSAHFLPIFCSFSAHIYPPARPPHFCSSLLTSAPQRC